MSQKCQFFTFHYQGLTKNRTAEIVKIMAAPGTVLVDLVGYLASPSPSGAGAGASKGSGGSGGSGRSLVEAWLKLAKRERGDVHQNAQLHQGQLRSIFSN
jgi:hypothetical protein